MSLNALSSHKSRVISENPNRMSQEITILGRKFVLIGASNNSNELNELAKNVDQFVSNMLAEKDVSLASIPNIDQFLRALAKNELLSFAQMLSQIDPSFLLTNLVKFLPVLEEKDLYRFATLVIDHVSIDVLIDHIPQFLDPKLGKMNPLELAGVICENGYGKEYFLNVDKFIASKMEKKYSIEIALTLVENVKDALEAGVDKKTILDLVKLVIKGNPYELSKGHIQGLLDANFGDDFVLELAKNLAEFEVLLIAEYMDIFIKGGLKLDEKALQEFPDREMAHFALLMKEINPDMYDAIIKSLPLIPKDTTRDFKMFIITSVSKFPADDREECVKAVLSISSLTQFRLPNRDNHPILIKKRLFDIAGILPKGLRTHIFNQIEQLKISSLSDLFKYIASQKEIDQIFSFMNMRLESFTDPLPAFAIIGLLLEFSTQLGFHDEHPFYQNLLNIHVTSNPDMLEHAKNPYRVYRELNVLAKEKSTFTPPRSTGIAGKIVSYQLEEFTKQIQSRVYSIDDLPKGIDSNTLKDFFISLRKRMEIMSPDERGQLEKYIQEMTSTSLSKLEKNFLSDYFIDSLLNLNNSSEVPIYTFQFFHLLQEILNASDTLGANQLLTDREELLLKISSSIQACKGGKKEGIAMAFNWFKIPTKGKEEHEGSILAFDHIHTMIEEKILNLVSGDNSFMRDVIGGAEKVEQLSHQSIYIKNLLLGRIPLNQKEIEFDRYTGTISTILIPRMYENEIALERLERYHRRLRGVLGILHKYLPTPKDLILEFRDSVNQTIKKEEDEGMEKGKIGTFQAFAELLEAHKTSLSSSEIWEYDENTMLTEEGAQEVLVRAGLLASV